MVMKEEKDVQTENEAKLEEPQTDESLPSTVKVEWEELQHEPGTTKAFMEDLENESKVVRTSQDKGEKDMRRSRKRT